MNAFRELLDRLLGLGLESKDLSWLHLSVRSIVVFIATLIIIRFTHKRFMAHRSALDVVLGFILASVLARAINGTAPFFGTLWAGLLLVLLHRVLNFFACRSLFFARLAKGTSATLIREGVVDESALREHGICREDLLEDMRINGSTEDERQVKLAHLERNGEISILRKPRVLEITGEATTKTQRIVVEQ
jgi:uncharacterized membrane protein YcaP (DUF421 family)